MSSINDPKTVLEQDELLSEYNFNYSKAHPNRFVTEKPQELITVVLEPDIAKVFKTSDAVNKALRAILSAIPQ
ncbi:hypothetical protein [Synechocystis salina]|uniref:Uncharacterized protein n=1 Tax=Synechocystis salina LEGE 00031 TaxID=1828736 RepID=A0ABR9VZL4_9SYNC|nr:hypothetical protein [Synechocystis salina]MBE9242837.1 hypothetical protein [Synechocystis salina LEGE 00041]MBE9255681.1 hypothetical protein [Synechocystis salina LEGE 00031]